LWSRATSASPALVRRAAREVGERVKDEANYGDETGTLCARELVLEQQRHLVAVKRPQIVRQHPQREAKRARR
jgi:hypothetical protein